MSTAINAGIALLLLAVVFLAGFIVWDKLTVRPVGTASVVATEAPAVRKAPTATVAIKAPVKVYRGESKANLKLPPLVISDSHKEVLAASQVESNLRPQTVSTVIDTETGAVTTYTKTDPYPWLAVETRGELKLAHGYKYNHVLHNSAQVTRLQASYDVVRIKALTVGVTATVDSDSTAFAGVALSYKW